MTLVCEYWLPPGPLAGCNGGVTPCDQTIVRERSTSAKLKTARTKTPGILSKRDVRLLPNTLHRPRLFRWSPDYSQPKARRGPYAKPSAHSRRARQTLSGWEHNKAENARQLQRERTEKPSECFEAESPASRCLHRTVHEQYLPRPKAPATPCPAAVENAPP